MSKGVAIAEAINDATERRSMITEIVDTVNAIQSEHIRGTEGSGSVEAQSGTDGSSNINVTELSEYIKPVSEPVRSQKDSYRPDTASCKNGDGLSSMAYRMKTTEDAEFFYNKDQLDPRLLAVAVY